MGRTFSAFLFLALLAPPAAALSGGSVVWVIALVALALAVYWLLG